MGIKMRYARFNGEKIDVNNCKDYMKNDLYCYYCGTPISYVSGSIRSLKDRDVVVRPYFRLKNEQSIHVDNCKYITSNAIKEIFADVADSNLMTKQEDAYIARLHIITDSMEKKDNKHIADLNDIKVNEKSTKKYIKNGDKPAYLSTIRRIVKLRDAIEKEKELRDLVKLQFYNEYHKKYDVIKWKNFYMDYDLKSYKHIYEMLKATKVYHPICFEGEIKEAVQIGETFYIKFYSLKVEEGLYYSFSAATKNKEVFKYASTLKGKRVVIYGCSHHVSKEGNKNETRYLNFSSYINIKTQIFVL
ncbi:hypothetical protein ACWG0P_05760 [Amedibacillus sp. YH-ame6]